MQDWQREGWNCDAFPWCQSLDIGHPGQAVPHGQVALCSCDKPRDADTWRLPCDSQIVSPPLKQTLGSAILCLSHTLMYFLIFFPHTYLYKDISCKIKCLQRVVECKGTGTHVHFKTGYCLL